MHETITEYQVMVSCITASPAPYAGEDAFIMASPTPYTGEDATMTASPTPYTGGDAVKNDLLLEFDQIIECDSFLQSDILAA